MARKFILPTARKGKPIPVRHAHKDGSVILTKFVSETVDVFEERVRRRAGDIHRDLKGKHLDCSIRVTIVWASDSRKARIHYAVETLTSVVRRAIEDEGE